MALTLFTFDGVKPGGKGARTQKDFQLKELVDVSWGREGRGRGRGRVGGREALTLCTCCAPAAHLLWWLAVA